MQEAERKPVVYADIREERSGIPSLIEEEGVTVVRKQLPVGDYIVSGDIVVERKSAPDFAKSLFDGRLFEQAARLADSYPLVVYIVEGDPLRLKRYRGRINQLTSAIITLMIDFNARVIYSLGERHTAYIIASMAKRTVQSGRRGVVIHKKPRLTSPREWQLYILQSFPGIGPKTAERILEHFGSIEAFVNASKAEIAKIPGIGEKKAEQIKRIILARYPGARKGPKRATLDDFV